MLFANCNVIARVSLLATKFLLLFHMQSFRLLLPSSFFMTEMANGKLTLRKHASSEKRGQEKERKISCPLLTSTSSKTPRPFLTALVAVSLTEFTPVHQKIASLPKCACASLSLSVLKWLHCIILLGISS